MDKVFDANTYKKEFSLAIGQYEDCQFIDCELPGYDLSGYVFIDCHFQNCNLSNAKINQTAFREVTFKQSKLMGLHFDDCNEFLLALSFHSCNLSFCTFSGLKMRKTIFHDSDMQEVDFSQTDLTEANFKGSNLSNATFAQSILKKADFSEATNFIIDPEMNSMAGAKFSRQDLEMLLLKYRLKVVN